MRNFWIISFLIYCSHTFSQKIMQGQIIDFDTTVPIAFAKISYNNNTFTSDWEGRFSLEIINDKKPILFLNQLNSIIDMIVLHNVRL